MDEHSHLDLVVMNLIELHLKFLEDMQLPKIKDILLTIYNVFKSLLIVQM
jgi:hypothetical protein